MSKVLSFVRGKLAGLNKSKNEEPRRDTILNIILLSMIALSVAATVSLVADPGVSSGDIATSMRMVLNGLLFFVFLYCLSISGYAKQASAVLSASFFVIATFMAARWGSSLPQALLFYVLSIIVSSILSGSRLALALTVSASVALPAIHFAHSSGYLQSDLTWRLSPPAAADIYVYAAVIVVIFIVSWLYNWEIDKAFQRALLSEATLKDERDLLEIRVEERSAELKRDHLEHISQLSRFVEFGKLSSGIFHDMANHLSILLLMLDEKMVNESAEIKRARGYLEEFRRARTDLEKFVSSTKRRLREVSYAYFYPDQEIVDLLKLIKAAAEKESVSIEFHPGASSDRLSGSPAKFSHIVTNLISNAVESYDPPRFNGAADKKVIVKTAVDGKNFVMEVRDFGCGIAEDDKTKIFVPFFTTKEGDKGTGLGLAIVKETVENDFGGEISFDSLSGSGTVFTVKLPVLNLYDRLG